MQASAFPAHRASHTPRCQRARRAGKARSLLSRGDCPTSQQGQAPCLPGGALPFLPLLPALLASAPLLSPHAPPPALTQDRQDPCLALRPRPARRAEHRLWTAGTPRRSICSNFMPPGPPPAAPRPSPGPQPAPRPHPGGPGGLGLHTDRGCGPRAPQRGPAGSPPQTWARPGAAGELRASGWKRLCRPRVG